ncbi:MAG: hypothetical protein LLG42_08460 [Chloroflexi bacterium]|nr:hypothetical protein [Chloroflexota bacterium]
MSENIESVPQASDVTADAAHAEYFKNVHKIGRIFCTLLIFANALPVFLVWAFYGIFPPLNQVLPALFVMWGILLPFFLTEGWMYYGVLGVAGNYMQWAGNSSNFRVPVVAVAQEVVGTKTGSMKYEIVGNIAASTSIFFSVAFILAGALLGNLLIANLPPWVLKAFAYAIPCVFGALVAQFSMRGPKYAIPIILIMYLLVSFTGLVSWQRIVLMIIVILPLMWFAYKKKGIYWVTKEGGGED